jgi:protein-tyrosine kinase
VVTAAKTDLAHVPFDIMRTRILKICREKGWRRIGVTSATKHCGKTFVSVNLAFSMVRNPEIRCMLIDFDLRRPSLQRLLRLLPTTTFEHHLRGDARAIDVLLRVRPNLAVACSAPTAHSSELIQSPRTLDALAQMQTEFAPDVMIFDMPPALAGDDVLSTLGAMDALLVVAAAGTTTAQDIRDAEQMFSGAAGFLGVVLNKVDPADAETLAYDYATASVA